MRLLQTVGFLDSLPPAVEGSAQSPQHCTGIAAHKRDQITKTVYYKYTNTATSAKLRLADAPTEIRAGARLQNLGL